MLHSPTERRERLLIYGRSNSGKSSTWLALADWRNETGADFNIYVGDTDHAWDAMRDEADQDPDAIHVRDLDMERYREWIEWAREVRGVVNPDDWVVVDMVDKAWEAAQGHYWGQKGNDLLADVYAKNQDEDSMGGAYGANWGVINKYYRAFFQTVMSVPCHVLCVSPATEIREYHKAEVRNQYKVGWMPAGQKDLPHSFHSVIFAAEVPDGWVYTTVRERGPIGRKGRRMMKGEKVDDFVTTYLFGVCGWRP